MVDKEEEEEESMGNMPSLLFEEDTEAENDSRPVSGSQPESQLVQEKDSEGNNKGKEVITETSSKNELHLENESELVVRKEDNNDDVSNEIGEEERQKQQTLIVNESNELISASESELAVNKGDKDDVSKKDEIIEEEEERIDSVTELRLGSESELAACEEEEDEIREEEEESENLMNMGGTESVTKLNELHRLVSGSELASVGKEGDNNDVEDMDKNGKGEDEGKLENSHVVDKLEEDGVGTKGGEESQKVGLGGLEVAKDELLNNVMEEKHETEKQDERGGKTDELEGEEKDEKDERVIVTEAENSVVMSELKDDKKDDKVRDIIAPTPVLEKIVSESKIVREEEKDEDTDLMAPVVDDLGPASKSEVIREEEKGKDINVHELDNSTLDSKSEVAWEDEEGKDISLSVLDDLTPATESNVNKKEEKDENLIAQLSDDSALIGESKDDTREEKDEEMIAEGEEIPRSENAPEKSQVVGEVEHDAVKDDVDQDPIAEEEEEEEEGTPLGEVGMDTEVESAEGGKSSGKRKRGRGSGAVGRPLTKKKIEEDVCFICFDGGDLVLCDRRGCPKAYHPSCVNRDEAFFQTKGRWNCGWHLCSICEKNAYYMCYTCTFSLCKGCIKDSVIYCIRGNKGFCETCMKMVSLIEKNEDGNKESQVDFSDKNSWEYLFKDYWLDMKEKLLLDPHELAQAKCRGKESEVIAGKQDPTEEINNVNNIDNSANLKASAPQRRKVKKRSKSLAKDEDSPSGSDSSPNLSGNKRKTRKANKRSKSLIKEGDSPSTASAVRAEGMTSRGTSEWASKELLEFVMHMKDGDTSVSSQFDVQALLLEYIKRNKLRDPRRKSQIVCDSRLQNLFGKPRVGHFEMLKLLESHFLIREESQADDFQGSVVDNEVSQLDTEENTEALITNKDRKRKMRKKGYERGLQSNTDDYAAIDIHNISLIFLRRNLVEALLQNIEHFKEKVIGSFVRIRISGAGQKQDMYRLVQVVGTSKAAEPYKVGKKTTEFMLEIQNLDKKEVISIDIISNQEFTEDECKRLRQSIKFGLINRMTVGDIQDKAMELQAVRVNDLLEAEIVRISHLCDRASETGRRKELRENVEKLQLLKTPEERQRRLEEFPKVHADPKMDPNHESEDDVEETDNKKQDSIRPRSSGLSRRGKDPLSPRKEATISSESWSGTKSYSSVNRELGRSLSIGGSSTKREDSSLPVERTNENLLSQGRSRGPHQITSWERQTSNSEVVSETPPEPPSVVPAQPTINESEKMWHYKDPSGKVQGPFSMAQLRKWSGTGYFPSDLRVWKITEKEDDSVLLTDALIGKFQKEPPPLDKSFANVQKLQTPNLLLSSGSLNSHGITGVSRKSEGYSQVAGSALTFDVPKTPTKGWGSDYGGRNDSTNLPSPTPNQTRTGGIAGQATENRYSPISPTRPSFGLDGSGSSQAAFNQLTRTRGNDATGSFNGVNVISRPEMVISSSSTQSFPSQSNAMGDLPMVQSIPAQQTDISSSISLPTLVQSAHMQQPAHNNTESQTCVSAPSNQVALPVQQQAYGQWDSQSGMFPTQGFLGSAPVNQLNMQPSAPQNRPWAPIPGNSNMGWGGSTPGYTNTNWQLSGQGPTPGNPSPGWVAPQNTNPSWAAPGNMNPGWVPPAPGQGQAPGNMNPSLVPPNQGPLAGNNTNTGWALPGQGSAPGSANQGWVAPSGNQGTWGNEQNHNGNRYSNQMDRNPQGASDAGSGGSRPWNRQSSFGLRVCNYHMSGHCKKGSSCDYLHPQKQ